MKDSRNRSLVLLVAISIIVVATLAVLYALSDKTDKSQTQLKEGKVTVEGTALCLPHRDTSATQTTECAIGIKTKDGQYYALKDSDPEYKNISKISTSKKIKVEGTFKKQANQVYPITGFIEITTIDIE